MIIERNVFQLRFGAGKSALDLWKSYLEKIRREDPSMRIRLLTDLSGAAYVIILELQYHSFGDADPSQCRLVKRGDWKEFYQQFIPYCEKSERTYYKLIADI